MSKYITYQSSIFGKCTIDTEAKTLYNHGNETLFLERDMDILKSNYRGVNRAFRPLPLLFYADWSNGVNLRKVYGKDSIVRHEMINY